MTFDVIFMRFGVVLMRFDMILVWNFTKIQQNRAPLPIILCTISRLPYKKDLSFLKFNLIIFYSSIFINILNIAALVGLALFVAVLQPALLIEAFNPVTTNLAMIAFSLVLIKEQKALNKNTRPSNNA